MPGTYQRLFDIQKQQYDLSNQGFRTEQQQSRLGSVLNTLDTEFSELDRILAQGTEGQVQAAEGLRKAAADQIGLLNAALSALVALFDRLKQEDAGWVQKAAVLDQQARTVQTGRQQASDDDLRKGIGNLIARAENEIAGWLASIGGGYKRIQFIGHSINTGPRRNLDGSLTYVGNAEDPVADVSERVSFVKDVLTTAMASTYLNKDSKVLKVLVLPEFFFRGREGAYPMRDVDNLRVKLQNLVSGPQWQDWIFVFGTILGLSQPEGSDQTEAYNFCQIQKGGFGDNQAMTDDLARVVMKEHKSGIDFIPDSRDDGTGTLVRERVHHLTPTTPPGPGREEQQKHWDGRGIFELAGITFGVEICLDHLYDDTATPVQDVRRLWHSPQLSGHQEAQIQIVPSCGMSICAEAVVAVKDGWVFNCDGLNTCETDLRQVKTAYTRSPAQPAQLRASSRFDPATITTTVNVNALFAHGAGELHFYGLVVIPDPVAVP